MLDEAVSGNWKTTKKRPGGVTQGSDNPVTVNGYSKDAAEFDGLYTESAKNLVGRSPELLMLLAAFQAGRARGEQEEKERHKPKQEVLK